MNGHISKDSIRNEDVMKGLEVAKIEDHMKEIVFVRLDLCDIVNNPNKKGERLKHGG